MNPTIAVFGRTGIVTADWIQAFAISLNGAAVYSCAVYRFASHRCSLTYVIKLLAILVPMFSGMIHPAAVLASGNTGFKPVQGIANAWDMPPLILEDLEGKQRSLYDWHGNVIILNFWASWCGPCQAEIPHLIRYQRTYAGRGLQIVGVGLDEKRKLRNFVRTFGIDYPILFADAEHGRALLGQWGDPRQILPFSVVIARDGHIHFIQTGILDEESFTDYVLPLLDVVSGGTV